MADRNPVIAQGDLTTKGQPIYRPVTGVATTITCMTFTIPDSAVDCVLRVEIADGTVTPIVLYKFTLDGGDVVVDTDEYNLTNANWIIASASVKNVSFIINGKTQFL